MGEKAVVLVHGGCGNIPNSRVAPKLAGVKTAVLAAIKALQGECSSSQKAACEAVASMENDFAFNAGYGSVLNEDGEVEMDAAVMNGKDLALGGIGAVGIIFLCSYYLSYHTMIPINFGLFYLKIA